MAEGLSNTILEAMATGIVSDVDEVPVEAVMAELDAAKPVEEEAATTPTVKENETAEAASEDAAEMAETTPLPLSEEDLVTLSRLLEGLVPWPDPKEPESIETDDVVDKEAAEMPE